MIVDAKEQNTPLSDTTTKPIQDRASAMPLATEHDDPNTLHRISVPLRVEVVPLSIPPMGENSKALARTRLADLVAGEVAKSRRDEAYNNLEGYLYRLRDLIDGHDDTPFKEFVQPSELTRLSQGLDDTLRWLNHEAETADAELLREKRTHLEDIERPVISRYKEASSGPAALSNLQKAHTLTRAFLMEAYANRTLALQAGHPPRFTEEELALVESTVNESEEWLKVVTAQQKLLTKRDDPVLRAADMESRGVTLQKLVKGLEKKRVPKPPRASTSDTRSESRTRQSSTAAKDGVPDSEATLARDEL